jgi:hypothetical protein
MILTEGKIKKTNFCKKMHFYFAIKKQHITFATSKQGQ